MANIRRALIYDAKAINDISVSLTTSRHGEMGSGFVEFPVHSLETWQEKIVENPFFYVAEDKHKIIGFYSSFTSEKLSAFRSGHDEITNHLAQENRSFIYNEQLGVMKEYQGRKVGTRLIETFLNDSNHKGKRMSVSAVIHRPIINHPSVKLISKHGWEFGKELTTKSGLTFGLYSRKV